MDLHTVFRLIIDRNWLTRGIIPLMMVRPEKIGAGELRNDLGAMVDDMFENLSKKLKCEASV